MSFDLWGMLSVRSCHRSTRSGHANFRPTLFALYSVPNSIYCILITNKCSPKFSHVVQLLMPKCLSNQKCILDSNPTVELPWSDWTDLTFRIRKLSIMWTTNIGIQFSCLWLPVISLANLKNRNMWVWPIYLE